MTDRIPTGAEIDERKWHDEEWTNNRVNYRGFYIWIGLGILTWVVIFILGVIVGHLFW